MHYYGYYRIFAGMLSIRKRFFHCLLLLSGLLSAGVSMAAEEVIETGLRFYWNFEKPDPSSHWMNAATRTEGSGNYFSHTDSLQPYGIGFRSLVPGGDGNRSFKANVSFRLRASALAGKPKLVFSIVRNDETVFWDSRDLAGYIKQKEEWFTVEGISQVLPASFTASPYQFVCYVWNSDGVAAVDIDDIQITFDQVSLPSFLPAISAAAPVAEGKYIDLYRGPFFSLQFDKVNGQCRIAENNQQVVFDSFWMFHELRADYRSGLQQPWLKFLMYEGDSLSEDGKVFRFKYRNPALAELKLIVPTDGRSLRVDFSYTVTEAIKLDRQSLVLHSMIPVSTIYTGQGNEQTTGFLEEYWLNKEGLTWSTASAEWSVYHPDQVSSLQFDKSKNILWINADYAGDHPLLYWPLESTSSNYRIDRSYSVYKPGDRVEGTFTLLRKEGALPLPRFLDAREGREAVLIFTEHADYTAMRSNKAVYFGADTVQQVKNATGGFVRHAIPVTKSVFYANPDRVDFSQRAGFIQGELATVKATDGFRQFLLDLQAEGHEIALHTPDHFTASRLLLNEALQQMSGFFTLKSWIDHGYDNGKRSNREDLVCDGFIQGSPVYAAPLFKEYGIRNLWNCFYEDSSIYERVTFNSELVTPHPAFGFSFPRPVQWVHPTVTGGLRHLRTTCTLAPTNGAMWDFYLGEKRLDFLVQHKGVYVAHVYPARIDSLNGFYCWNGDVWTVDPGFDELLKNISSYRQRGTLWVTTMMDYLNYSRDKDELRYTLDRSGFAVITNPTDRKMSGISMCIDGFDVHLTSKVVSRRKVGETTIFWFDLEPGESTTVRLVTEH